MPSAPGEATGTSGSSSCGPQGPPAAIEFKLGAKRLVRYYRMARSGDSDAAVLGKGGFGCVYRYALDTSFTPPSSVDLSLSLSPRHVGQQAPGRELVPGNGASTSNNTHSLAEASTIVKPPSLVAVKLCRTPCSGSFDELQKTSLVDKRTRRAELQDDRRTHVRIVRGEGRIFEYLQAAHQVSDQMGDVPLVKLLANLSPTGIDARQEQHSSLSMSEDEEDGPPTRLLVFEKLIELDAEPTPRGWAKSRKPWSHERVEKVAFEVMQGLRFLHEHNVTHGDLKPSNLMLDPRTGVVKIIDLGASRRFVHLSNRERNNRRAVEQQDRQALLNGRAVPRLAPELCEGLGSLTGSPYYMAPEILIQATRYIDISGKSRSVLEDYEYDYPSFLPRDQWSIFQIGLSDLKRGWGIRADIWSWACTVQALLLKTVEEEQRPSSSTISPYDFSFSRHRHEMTEPLYQKAAGEDDVPRFHQWCRVLPLLIVGIALEPVLLVAQADGCSPALRSALKASLRHQDLRPTADDLFSALQSARSSPQRTADARLHPADGVDGSPRRQDKAGHLAQLGAPEADYGSPQIRISELEGSRQTTPSLSRGTSRTSTPQHTCETIGRSASTRTPDRLNKGKVRLAACSMEMSPDRTAPKSCGGDDDRATSAMLPQGFELVSPPRNPKPRSTTLGDARRPATANARLPSASTWTRSADALRAEANARQMPRSASSVRTKTSSRPRTSPMLPDFGRSGGCLSAGVSGQMEPAKATAAGVEWVSDVADRGAQNSRTGDGELRPPLSAGAAPLSPSGSGLDAAMRGLRNLRLSRPSLGSQRTAGEISAPHSPSWHLRGSSMPVLGRGGESRAQPPTWTTQLDGSGIGDSPQCSVGEGKTKRQSNLMATLKEKQVRLKIGTLKLKGRRQESGEEGLGDCKMQRGGTDMVTGDVEMRVAQLPTTPGGEGTRKQEPPSPLPGRGGTRSRNTGSRSGAGTGGSADGKTASKQLLRRLLTWSASSS